jgi:hypothetical protein
VGREDWNNEEEVFAMIICKDDLLDIIVLNNGGSSYKVYIINLHLSYVPK